MNGPQSGDTTPRLDVSVDAEQRVLVLVGDVDVHTAEDLDAHLDRLGTGADVVVDLAGVGFIDSSGLRVVIAHHQRLGDASAALVLRSPSAAVTRLVQIAGLDEHLNVETGSPD